jgi:hypothetical protein
VKPEKADLLLRDLARWVFGQLLAERAKFQALPPEELASEVRAYRYGILCAALPEARGLGPEAQALVAAPWELMREWAELAATLSWGPEAEIGLSTHFLERMAARGELTEPLRRFARGKAFKYGRRVLMLSGKFDGA